MGWYYCKYLLTGVIWKLTTNLKKNFPIFLIASILIFILVVFIGAKNNSRVNKQSGLELQSISLKEFKSSEMDFSIDLPENFNVEEGSISIKLYSSNGEIWTYRNSTNFDNLTDYIENSRNNLGSRLTGRKSLTINGLQSVSGFIDEEKLYFVYTDNRVYILSTKNADLYSDLDQIAQSFRYTP